MLKIDVFAGLPLGDESFLIERYHSFICTCHYIEVYYPEHEVFHMKVSESGMLKELMVFGNRGNTCVCFNSLATIGQEVFEACIAKVFESYPQVKAVEIIASYRKYSLKRSIMSNLSDDYILTLPAVVDDFVQQLGHQTRKHLRQRQGKLDKNFNRVEYITQYGVEIQDTVVDDVIQMHLGRMECKGKSSGIDENYKSSIARYAKHYGSVSSLWLEGKLVAGCISSVIGKEIFVHVLANDNCYNKHNVGELCAFSLIDTAIADGLSRVHFLWGKSELKTRFLAQPDALYSYRVYRTVSASYLLDRSASMLRCAFIAFKKSRYSEPLRKILKIIRKRN